MTACIIPAREEAAVLTGLIRVLGSSPARTAGSLTEVIFVTTDSADDTQAICAAAAASDPLFKHLRVSPELSKFQSLLAGAASTDQNWLIFLDADIRPGAECMERLAAFDGSAVAVVQTTVLPDPSLDQWQERASIAGRIHSWSYAAAMAWDDLRFHYPEHRWALSGYCYAVRKDLLELHADCALIDDASVGLHCAAAGAEIVYDRGCVAYFAPPRTLADFLRQKLRTRVGWQLLRRRHPMKVKALRHELYRSLYRAACADSSLRPAQVRAIDGTLWFLAVFARISGAWRKGKWNPIKSTKLAPLKPK